jgi:hypothetical protein
MLVNWLDKFDLSKLNTLTCRLYHFLYDLGLYTNPWIMSMVFIERAISVCLPHKVKFVCTLNLARGNTIFLWVFCITIFSIYKQIIVGYPNPMGKIECAILQQNFHILNIHSIANIFVQFFLPYVFILGSTILIVVVLYTKTMKKSKSVGEQNLIVTKNLLMLINIAFILCVTPVMVVESLDTYRQQFDDYNYEEYLNNSFYTDIFRTIRGINSGLNFFYLFF